MNEEKFKILGVKIKEYEGKKYPHCYILSDNQYGFDIIDIKILEKQIPYIEQVINDDTFEVSRYISVQYNTFKKAYEPKITLGL